MNYERVYNRNTGSAGVPGADVWIDVLGRNRRTGIKMKVDLYDMRSLYQKLKDSEIILDTGNGFRRAKDPGPETKQKIKEALNYLYGKVNIMNELSKTYHLTKEQYRYKVDHMLLDIRINEATHKLVDQFHDLHKDQVSLRELLRLEDEERQLKDNYFILLNEYQDMCNTETLE